MNDLEQKREQSWSEYERASQLYTLEQLCSVASTTSPALADILFNLDQVCIIYSEEYPLLTTCG